MAGRSKRYDVLEELQNQIPEFRAAPEQEMKVRATESVGTNVLHWQNLRLQYVPETVTIPKNVTEVNLTNNEFMEFPEALLKVSCAFCLRTWHEMVRADQANAAPSSRTCPCWKRAPIFCALSLRKSGRSSSSHLCRSKTTGQLRCRGTRLPCGALS